MTNLLQRTVFGRFTELPSRSNQQISSKILRGIARANTQHMAHPYEDVSHRNPDADGKPLPSLKVL